MPEEKKESWWQLLLQKIAPYIPAVRKYLDEKDAEQRLDALFVQLLVKAADEEARATQLWEGAESGTVRKKQSILEYYQNADKKLFWIRILYSLAILDSVGVIIRLLLFWIFLNPCLLWSSQVYVIIGSLFPLAAWVVASDLDEFNYHRRKRRYLYLYLVHLVLLLSLPFFNAAWHILQPFLISIPITPYFSVGMILFFGRVCIFVIPVLLCSIIFRNMWLLFLDETIRVKINTFKLGHYVDTRKYRDSAYDLNVLNDLDTGEMITILEKDRYTQSTLVGNSGTGKTTSVIVPEVVQDLDRKAENDDNRYMALIKMVMEEKAVLNIPEEKLEHEPFAFRDSYVVPYEKYKKEYEEICERYKTCSVITLGPDTDLSDEVIKLCMQRGIRPKLVDPTLEGDPVRLQKYGDFLVGMNPLYVPDGMSIDDEAEFIMESARNMSEQLETIDAMLASSNNSDRFFSGVNRTVTSTLASIDMLYWRRAEHRQAKFTDFQKSLSMGVELQEKIQFLEERFGSCVNRGIAPVSPTIDANGIACGTIGTESGCALAYTPWESTFNYVYDEMLNLENDRIQEFSYGLRNIANEYIGNPYVRDLLCADDTLHFDEILENGEVVVCNYGLKLGDSTASSFGLTFQLSLNQSVVRRKLPESKALMPTPVWEYIDESPILAGPWMERTVALLRKYGVGAVFAMQTLDQMEKTDTLKYLKNLLVGVGTVIVFNRANLAEMKLFSDLSGMKEEMERMETSSRNSIIDGNENSYSERVSKSKENVFSASDIRYGDFLEVVVMTTSKGRVLKGRRARVHFITDEDREEVPRKNIDWKEVYRKYQARKPEELAYLRKLEQAQLEFDEKTAAAKRRIKSRWGLVLPEADTEYVDRSGKTSEGHTEKSVVESPEANALERKTTGVAQQAADRKNSVVVSSDSEAAVPVSGMTMTEEELQERAKKTRERAQELLQQMKQQDVEESLPDTVATETKVDNTQETRSGGEQAVEWDLFAGLSEPKPRRKREKR